nr:hypothetical protein Iba_chr09cCG7540 [Ipomoea batatas]
MARHYWGERSDDNIGGCRYWVGFGVLLASVVLLTVMIFSCMESPVSKVKKDNATEDSAANYGAECAAGCGALCGA